jgi:heme/copper-type cytochrome/quinol oxidase subunit 4
VNDFKNKAFRRGWIVFIILLLLTAVEFVVGVFLGASIALLFVISLLKAALIVYYFMHVFRLWREESHQ